MLASLVLIGNSWGVPVVKSPGEGRVLGKVQEARSVEVQGGPRIAKGVSMVRISGQKTERRGRLCSRMGPNQMH